MSNESDLNERVVIKMLPKNFLETEDSIKLYSVRYVCGYVAFKFFQRNSCTYCAQILLKPNNSESLEIESEYFLFAKEYDSNKEMCKLKAPTNYFFQIISEHLNVFDKYFEKNYFVKNIFEHIIKICTEQTPDWFSIDSRCYQHKILILHMLIRLMLRKNSIWLKENIIKCTNSKTKIKTRNSKKSKKLKIIKS